MGLDRPLSWRLRERTDPETGAARCDVALHHAWVVHFSVDMKGDWRTARAVFLSEDGELLFHRSWFWFDPATPAQQEGLFDADGKVPRPSEGLPEMGEREGRESGYQRQSDSVSRETSSEASEEEEEELF